MFVLTVDQRGSRRDVDRVGDIIDDMADRRLLRPFERTAGDEIQAVTDDPALLVLVALELIRREHWSVGIGIGPVEQPLPRQTRAGRGPAFEAHATNSPPMSMPRSPCSERLSRDRRRTDAKPSL
jgi:hypothetical protein